MNAYAACIYLHCKDGYNNFQTHLLCSKTKVAPLKSLTIPKLELCACLLGSQLIRLVKNALNIDVPIFMWSDSQIAISWIRSDPGLLQVFVSNRVSKIQSLPNIQNWRYINTKYNCGITLQTWLLGELRRKN